MAPRPRRQWLPHFRLLCPSSRESQRHALPRLPLLRADPPRSCKMADRPVPLRDARLLDVKLGQLPSWVATRDFTPSGLTGAVRRGYDRYLNKYINVKKGGIGGVAMVLFGYVVISYIWNYEHLKHDRWRKYH